MTGRVGTRRRHSVWRRATAATAVAAALAALAACGQIYPSSAPAQEPANGVKSSVDDVTIGFAQSQLAAPYFAAMQVRAEEIATEQGFRLLFQSANADPAVQMNQMQAMIAQGIDTLLVNATSVKGQKEMMTQIASQIPVIYIDTSVPGTGTTSVQSDNLTIGRESGKITAKRFLNMGKTSIKMVVLLGSATDERGGAARRGREPRRDATANLPAQRGRRAGPGRAGSALRADTWLLMRPHRDRRDLALPVDEERLAALTAAAARDSRGYRPVTWRDRVPDALLEDRASTSWPSVARA